MLYPLMCGTLHLQESRILGHIQRSLGASPVNWAESSPPFSASNRNSSGKIININIKKLFIKGRYPEMGHSDKPYKGHTQICHKRETS